MAGETISTSAEGDMARALESIINPANNSEDNGTRGNTQINFNSNFDFMISFFQFHL